MREFKVTEIDLINRRKDGSVSFFRGTIDVDGTETQFRIQTKLTDEGAVDIRIDGGTLNLPDTFADRLFAARAAAEARRGAENARLSAAAEEAYGFILSRLSQIEAASESQAAYAERVRIEKTRNLVNRLGSPADAPASEKAALEVFYDEVAAEKSARFWLDVRKPFEVFRKRTASRLGIVA